MKQSKKCGNDQSSFGSGRNCAEGDSSATCAEHAQTCLARGDTCSRRFRLAVILLLVANVLLQISLYNQMVWAREYNRSLTPHSGMKLQSR